MIKFDSPADRYENRYSGGLDVQEHGDEVINGTLNVIFQAWSSHERYEKVG